MLYSCIFIYLALAGIQVDRSEQDKSDGEKLRSKGIELKNSGDFINALHHYRLALASFREKQDTIGVANVFNNIGTACFYLGYFDSCLVYYNESIKLFEYSDDLNGVGKVHINLGNYYAYEDKDFRKALTHYKESAVIFTELKQLHRIVVLTNNIANVFATDLPNNHAHNLDSARFYYGFALRMSIELKDSMQIGGILMNLGRLAESASPDSAVYYYAKSLKIFKGLGNDYKVASVYLNLGNFYKNRSQFFKAVKNNSHVFAIAYKNNYWDFIHSASKNLAEVYEKMNKLDSALHYFKRYSHFSDSIYNETKSRQIAELQTKYETEKKEKEIIAQRSQLQQANIERNEMLLMLVASLLLGVVAVLFFRQRSRTLKLVNQKNEELYSKEINKLLKDRELKALDAMIEGQEKERKRIAEELHDRLGNTLSAVKMHVEALAGNDAHKKEYKYINKILDTAVEDTRQISHNMLSGVLTKFGLIAALRDLKETIESTNKLEVTVETIQFDERLEMEKEINLYRIVQELMSNTLRHASATKLAIRLEKKGSELELKVSDDGKGMSAEGDASGIGLRNIESRVKKIGGMWRLTSRPGDGTYATVTVPV